MPSRLGIAAIVVFWLVSTSWLVVREIVPRLRTGQPPGFFTDLTDEMGGTTIGWSIYHKGVRIGAGDSKVERRRSDRTYVLSSRLLFENFDVLFVKITKIGGFYHIDKEGNLKELATEVKIMLNKREVKGE